MSQATIRTDSIEEPQMNCVTGDENGPQGPQSVFNVFAILLSGDAYPSHPKVSGVTASRRGTS